MKRAHDYTPTIIALATHVARITFQRRGVLPLVTIYGRQHLPRTIGGEGLALVRNARRTW